VVYTGSILSGEYIYWQHCWERFVNLQRTSETFVERMQLLRALGRTKDAWLQNRLLSHVTMLPTEEVVQVLKAIAGTPTGGAMACRFLQAKWFELEKRLGPGTISFAKVISSITQYGATKFDYDEVCFENHSNKAHCPQKNTSLIPLLTFILFYSSNLWFIASVEVTGCRC